MLTLIIGSGLSAYTLVRELRKRSADIKLSVITADDGHYYSKPQLSSAFTHHKTPEQLVIFPAEKYAQQFQFELKTHTAVTAIYPDQHRCETSQGDVHYDQLILAVGADAVKLPGARGVWQVNDLTDYRAFRLAVTDKKHIGIIGAGLVGCEFANDLLNAGFQVTIIAPEAAPLARLVPAVIGESLQQGFAEKGAKWHLGRQVVSATSNEIVLDNGETIHVDAVLTAIGLRPRTKLAKQAGVAVDHAIKTDAYLRTNQPNIFALGDCMAFEGRWLPYVAPLSLGARALAATLTGTPTPLVYPPLPVYVKTPACPIAVLPPTKEIDGAWETTHETDSVKALFYDRQHKLCGFALAGKATTEVPDLLRLI